MRVLFTKRAEKKYHSIKEYITKEWGARVAEAFEQKTIDFIDILADFPEIGVVEVLDKQIRGFQLTKQTRVYYRVRNESIIVLTFFDVRQNPKRKPS